MPEDVAALYDNSSLQFLQTDLPTSLLDQLQSMPDASVMSGQDLHEYLNQAIEDDSTLHEQQQIQFQIQALQERQRYLSQQQQQRRLSQQNDTNRIQDQIQPDPNTTLDPSQVTGMDTAMVQSPNTFRNQSFKHFRHSSQHEFDALISPYIMGEATGMMVDGTQDEEDFLLTPLVSPAMTPSADFQKMTIGHSSQVFSPLTSPVVHPLDNMDAFAAAFSPAFDPFPSLDGPTAPSAHLPAAMIDHRSPALQPVGNTTIQAQTGSRRKDTANSPGLSAIRERPKKQPLSSPYIVPRKNSTPLVSPALKPTLQRSRSSRSPDAANPSPVSSTESSASSTSVAPVFKTPFPILPSKPVGSTAQAAAAAAATLISPALTPQLAPSINGISLAPITPAQLMKLDHGQLSAENISEAMAGSSMLNALISPALKPLLPAGAGNNMEAARRLTQKSNYQNIREGNTETIGLKYNGDVTASVEARRDCHKQAEQRRRDSLKQCFEELRNILPPINEKNPSKVLVLKKSCEYILELQNKERDTEFLINQLRTELSSIKTGNLRALQGGESSE